MAARVVTLLSTTSTSSSSSSNRRRQCIPSSSAVAAAAKFPSLCSSFNPKPSRFQQTATATTLTIKSKSKPKHGFCVVACLPPPKSTFNASTKLYVSGLSFRTTEESLRNAFQNFGQLAEVNLVMDRIANRPRGFAFLRYATEEESKKAIEGMHGKFLDGRVIFVEVAKPRSEIRQSHPQNPRQY